MTRMAQLARQLREEAARWLGVFGDDANVRQKIGTPTGYQTSVCRESWGENLPKKDRSNLRHHLWDAAVISHIPPGKGMNLTNCAGIFLHTGTNQHGNITMRAIPGLGPDLNSLRTAQRISALLTNAGRPRVKNSALIKPFTVRQTQKGLCGRVILWTNLPRRKTKVRKDCCNCYAMQAWTKISFLPAGLRNGGMACKHNGSLGMMPKLYFKRLKFHHQK